MKRIIFLAAFLALSFSCSAHASTPVLYFSDITSGPATGLGDGLGSGVIVTIWGANLGTSQGASTISACGVSPAHVYEWTAADIHTGHPTALNTYRTMQVVSFSLGSGASGSAGISVTVGGVTSNVLPFTVRSGHIYFACGSSGCGSGSAAGNNDTGNGTWALPWADPQHALWANNQAGTTVYVGSGVNPTGSNYPVQVSDGYTAGTRSAPNAVIAYPGASVTVTSSGGSIGSWEGYFTVSKLALHGANPCVLSSTGIRAVGCECTPSTDQCPASQIGAMGSGSNNSSADPNSDIKFLGNYVHDLGTQCSTTWDSGSHTFYMANRTGILADYGDEIGWNYLLNNRTNAGVHWYDEGNPGDWGTPNLAHDNVVVNQYGTGLDYGNGGDPDAVTGVSMGSSGGSGYTQGDILTISGGSYANVVVTSVSGGVVTGIALSNSGGHPAWISGRNYSTGTNISTSYNGNGVGATVNITSVADSTMYTPFYAWNNLLINTGLDGGSYWGTGAAHQYAISVTGVRNVSPVYIYDNTAYGWGNNLSNADSCGLFISDTGGNHGLFGGTLYLRNNIFIDTQHLGFTLNSVAPAYHSNNLWYYSGGSSTPPSWDTSPLNVDPLFTNAGSGDFSLQGGSPALAAGYNLTGTYPYDIMGGFRPVPQSIGAFDAGTGSPGTYYTVTPSAGSNGAISPNTPQSVLSGETQAFTVTPSSGYTASVGGTCGGSLSSTTYTTSAIAADCTVSATFALNGSSSGPFSSGTGPIPRNSAAAW